MNNIEKAKQINLTSGFIISLFLTVTNPTIHVYMIQSISTEFYKVIEFLNNFLGLSIFFLIDKKDENGFPVFLYSLRKYFVLIIIIGTSLFVLSNFLGLYDTRIRFVMLAIIEGTSSLIWGTIIGDLFNQVIHNTDLSLYFNKAGKYDKVGSIIGAFLMLIVDLNIEIVLGIQCLIYIYMAYCDIRIYNLLTKEIKDYIK